MNRAYDYGRIDLTPQQIKDTSDAMLRTLLELGESSLALAEREKDVRYFELRRLVDDVGLEIDFREWNQHMVRRCQPSLFAREGA